MRRIGFTALVFSALYFLSDVIEAVQGGFSDGQLWLTLVSEAAVPVFVVGLARVHQPHFTRVGLLSAWAYAASYVVFTGTVAYALVTSAPDYATLNQDLGLVMLVPGVVMVLAGLGFADAVRRARRLPAWTAVSLMVGVVLVAAAQGLPEGAQVLAAGVRDLGFAGMGAAALTTTRRRQSGRRRRVPQVQDAGVQRLRVQQLERLGGGVLEQPLARADRDRVHQ
jgi:hypothetical protein